MTNNHYGDYLPTNLDSTDVEVILSDTRCPGLDPLIDAKVALLHQHTMLHITGNQSTPAHTECLRLLDEVECRINAAYTAIWN